MSPRQDAGSLNSSSAGSDFTRLSSSDLDGAGSRLHSIANALRKLADRYAGHPTLGPDFARSARHYEGMAAELDNAGLDPKTGQSTVRSLINNWLRRELPQQTREGDR